MLIRCALLPLAFAGALCAQTANPLTTDLKTTYAAVKNNLMKMAEKMPEENYSYKPTPDIRSFGQLVGHVADAQASMCSSVTGEAKALGASTKTSKADLVAALKQSFDTCDAVINTMTDESATQMIKGRRGERPKLSLLTYMVSHSNEEYGYMSVYLRLKSITPPSSEGR